MKIIYNRILPFRGFSAINIFGVVFARMEYKPLSESTMRHEAVHTAQMRELLYAGFYVCYLAEWLCRLPRQWLTGENAYRRISFEREAYAGQDTAGYLDKRRHFAQWRV